MSFRSGDGKRSSFVVRVVENARGEVSGVIERVATGAKVSFGDLEAVGQVIREMLRDAPAPSAPSYGPGRQSMTPPPS